MKLLDNRIQLARHLWLASCLTFFLLTLVFGSLGWLVVLSLAYLSNLSTPYLNLFSFGSPFFLNRLSVGQTQTDLPNLFLTNTTLSCSKCNPFLSTLLRMFAAFLILLLLFGSGFMLLIILSPLSGSITLFCYYQIKSYTYHYPCTLHPCCLLC